MTFRAGKVIGDTDINIAGADDGNTEVFYLKNATATISSFTDEPKVIQF
ncbi:hypothetical protein [Lacrimispora sp.]